MSKQIIKIVEFYHGIWILYEKCIQISANMPSIGLLIPEILQFDSDNPNKFNVSSTFNAFHAAGECRRQVKDLIQSNRCINILPFG